ncbi:MAG TPA: transposase [Bacteroidales bacterium]|nr:transposase [Bacteroidales bacterium]
MKKRRTFSIEEKLSLLREPESNGITETCRRHDLSHSVFNRWKYKFHQEGVEGLKPGYPKVDPEVRRLEDENRRLKKIIGDLQLELEVKGELLKKTPIGTRRK